VKCAHETAFKVEESLLESSDNNLLAYGGKFFSDELHRGLFERTPGRGFIALVGMLSVLFN